MLYELRTYTAMPGRLPDLYRRSAEITLGYFKLRMPKSRHSSRPFSSGGRAAARSHRRRWTTPTP